MNIKLIQLCFLVVVLATSCKNKAHTDQEKAIVSSSKEELVVLNSFSEFKQYIDKDNVKVKLKAGNYQIDEAEKIRFIEITGNHSYFDLTGVRFMVDTKLFSRTDLEKSDDGNSMYCAIEISGNDVTLEGLYIETYGDKPGIQSKIKFSIW